ncbi:hypothetical protein ACFL2H_06630 [Planctomycetota bacterium]
MLWNPNVPAIQKGDQKVDPDDERHLFDLILGPLIEVPTSLAVPAAIILSCVAILQGRFLFAIPMAILLVLGLLGLILLVRRFFVENFRPDNSTPYHRFDLWLVVSMLLLSLVVIASYFLGAETAGPQDTDGATSTESVHVQRRPIERAKA